MPSSFNRPGVVVESFPPPPDLAFRTGVAGFVGPASGNGTEPLPLARLFTSWPDFAAAYRDGGQWRQGVWTSDGALWHGVQGFFANGGSRCWVVLHAPAPGGDQLAGLATGVAALAQIDDVDLVCAPSLMFQLGPLALQQQLIRSAEVRDDWFLILDAPSPTLQQDLGGWIASLRAAPSNRPYNAALYHPWLVPGGDVEPAPENPAAPPDNLNPIELPLLSLVQPGDDILPGAEPDLTMIPASGHVAGIFARTDARVGVHKAPANEPIEGIVDVVANVDDVAGANPIRAYPGRGIRVWGARTLAVPSSVSDPHAYVGVRRLVVTLDRWLVRALDWAVFETNDVRTWVRIHRELDRRLTTLFEQGAFQGAAPDEAFYIKCDDENNPPDVRTRGELHVEIGIAAAVPKEFIAIHLVRRAEGTTVQRQRGS